MQSTKETFTGHAGLEKIMQTSLWRIAKKAKENKKYRFRNLYRLLNEEALYRAWWKINKSAASGIDKVTAKKFKENLEENIQELLIELKEKKYKAKLIKRVYIPKSKTEERPLGITTIRDKIVQRAVADILEAIYEQDFIEDSYGYRQGKNAHQAIESLSYELSQRYTYVVEADIKGFFNNIDHEWMIKMLNQRINDKAFLRLDIKWLKAGIFEPNGEIIKPEVGCPQGSVISPILANIYLHYALDLWFKVTVTKRTKVGAYICRLADDFVCAFRYKDEAVKFYNSIGKRLEQFGLELAKGKTKLLKFTRFQAEKGETFTFLGFEFRWKKSRRGKAYIAKRTDKKKLRKSIKKFKDWCRENRHNRIRKIVDVVNTKLRGYFNYYGIRGNDDRIGEFYYYAYQYLHKYLNRRSQRKSFNHDEFKDKMKYYKLLKPKIAESKWIQMSIEDLEFC
jgi:RNA-directed DNA polymerase